MKIKDNAEAGASEGCRVALQNEITVFCNTRKRNKRMNIKRLE